VSISLPDELEISTISAPSAAMSPDGSQLVFTGAGGGARRLYLRRLDQDDAVALAGTETGSQGVFAPDGRSIAFISADRALKTVSLADGLVAVVTRGVDRSFGASWGSDGKITFVRERELWQISPGGGEPSRLTTLDTSKGDLFHAWPIGLPGGGVLFNAVTGIGTGAMRIDVVLPATGERRTVVESGGYPQFAPSGHLMFMREGTLVVAPFDMERMQVSGPVARLAEDVTRDTVGAPLAFVSTSGALVYVSRQAGASRLVWLSRQGVETPLVDRVQAYSTPRISPDGRRIITDISGDMWVLDIERSSFTRLTSNSFANNSYGAWTPDGARVVFRTALGISVTNADGTGQPELLPDTSVSDFANAVTPDGGAVFVTRQTADRSGDVYLVSLRNEFKPRPIVSTPAYEGGVRLSPDGKWMAYASDESGHFEVYVQPTSGPGRRELVSADGGTNAIWNRTGNELIYRQGNRLMAVRVTTTPTLAISKPATLFEQRFVIGTSMTIANYDMSPDGQRFVVIKNQSNSSRLEVALNWTEELRRLAPP
jgi:Tol biopolymer transport system component